jgi:hypothetical protein
LKFLVQKIVNMKKAILITALLVVVTCQPTFAVGQDVPDAGSSMSLLSLALVGLAAISWKRKK